VTLRRQLAVAPLVVAASTQGCAPPSATPREAPRGAQTVATIRVDATPSHTVNSFRPWRALGTSVDRVPSNATDAFFEPAAIQQALSAGWGAITYRQNTDLFVQAWHWNPKGRWSDASGEGYFVGDAAPTEEPIRHSYGYALPHRGVTRNEGTEFDGYSRLDDGDLETYWKSNPYLSPEYTGEDESLHPQWLAIDLEKKQPVDAIRIAWAEPHARRYEVQYWTGENAVSIYAPPDGEWKTFASGVVTGGQGGTVTLRLAASPVVTRWVRVWMTQSSKDCDSHGPADRRNCLGFAVKEVYLGRLGGGADPFRDLLRHSSDQKQSPTFSSSIDPWHRPSDLYVAPDRMESGDQPGLDLLYSSGITRGLPAMIPVALLYGTPDDAAAQIRYLEKRGDPISHVELGEEAEGQYMLPEDYGALYLQWAAAIHAVDPALRIGGPSFTGSPDDLSAWPDAKGRTSWLARFLDYLRSHGRLSDLAFLSFEHYPGDDCEAPWESLYREPAALTHVMQTFRNDGLPADLPMFVTEINDHGADAAVSIHGALFVADVFAGFLTAGGKGIYYYHGLPYSPAHPNCANSWGTYHMFALDSKYRIRQRTSQYYAAQLMTREWTQPGDAEHRLYRATADVQDAAGHALVTSYAVLRPDGQWSLLLVNKDLEAPHPVRVAFFDEGSAAAPRSFRGDVTMISYGKAQYQWHSAMKNGYADPDDPPASRSVRADAGTVYELPAASITVLRGRL
jgi:hypothetical protein